ncbi:MAG: putative lipid II flippase FtsW [Clostridia bacterium]|nr:putative lipid II flippase FtsW [Clostridia bacterium]
MAQSGTKGGTRRVNKTEPKPTKTQAQSARSANTRSAKTQARTARSANTRSASARAGSRNGPRSAAAGAKAASGNAASRGWSAANRAAAQAKTIKEKLVRMGEIDYTLLFLIILVVAMGIIVMLSASAPSGNRMQDDSYYYFKRQIIFIIMGFVGMMMVSRINLDSFLKLIPKGFIVCVILLVLVLIPGIGVESHGARRWLNIPLIQLQPSELMKPMIAMYIAYLIKIGFLNLKELKSNLICACIISFVALLLMLETHLSGTIVIVGIAVCVMIAGGTPIKPLVIGGIIIVVAIVIYLQFDEIRMARVYSLVDPFADAQGRGYQISQSIYAIGSGRLFGLGLGQSVQKYSNLPEPYNDFIFSIVCEELGFFGGVVVILLFAALFLRSMRVAMNAPDLWSSLTCVGIAAQLGIQTFLNMGVAVSLIPNTGVSLPFFSYGGTSIFTLLLEMGVLLNISRKSVKD